MSLKKSSLRTRIFIAMIFLVVIASVLIAAITIYHYNEQAEDYHNRRLERKEEAIKEAITYELIRARSDHPDEKELPVILEKKLNEISNIHNLDINIYDLKGDLIKSSNASFGHDTTLIKLPEAILRVINSNEKHRVVLPKLSPDGKQYKSSYSFLFDVNKKPYRIIGVPYLQDNTFQDEELKEFLERLSLVYLIILIIAIIFAYILSTYIAKSIENVSKKMQQTTLDKTNEKIVLEDSGQEIYNLVSSYNSMVDQIEESAVKLALVERKHAWREMAKQVAHEIKNPLTPMRLTVQSFEHRFDPSDPEIKQKLHEFSQSLIQQIDTMSSIASAFSNFAEMPTQKKEELNVVKEVKLALDIFYEDFIHYEHVKDEITALLDKIQLTRVITNMVTNAIQSLKNHEDPKIVVSVIDDNKNVVIIISDNGIGISDEDKNKIFEPKFTTKSSGMGLGLPMVKNIIEAYNGTLTFESKINEGTIFTVTLPKR